MAPVRLLFGTTIVGVLLVLAPATIVYAAPDVEAQIDTAWNKLEPLIEQYNAVHGQLASGQAKAAEISQRLGPLQLQVELSLGRVSDIAVRYYKGGPTSAINALLSGGSPTVLADQLSLLNQVARVQADELRAVTTARDAFAAEKKTLDAQIKLLAAQDADLAAKKKDIESQIADLEKIRRAAGSAAATAAKLTGACPVEAASGAAATAVQTACAQRGKPYRYGAEGPNNFDCSGLTLFAWKAAGRTLPHNARAQYQSITHISRDQVRSGDLVFFYGDLHHVGMAIGGGLMVHSPRSGELVQVSSMDRPGVTTVYGRVG